MSRRGSHLSVNEFSGAPGTPTAKSGDDGSHTTPLRSSTTLGDGSDDPRPDFETPDSIKRALRVSERVLPKPSVREPCDFLLSGQNVSDQNTPEGINMPNALPTDNASDNASDNVSDNTSPAHVLLTSVFFDKSKFALQHIGKAGFASGIAIIFGMLASEDSNVQAWMWVYAFSAALANYPMAARFFTKFIKDRKEMWKKLPFRKNNPDSDPIFFCFALVELTLGLFTTVASIALAKLAVSGLLNSEEYIEDPLVGMYALYTLCTRLGGSHDLLYGDLYGAIKYMRQRYFSNEKYTPYLQLQRDLTWIGTIKGSNQMLSKTIESKLKESVKQGLDITDPTAVAREIYKFLSDNHIKPKNFNIIDAVELAVIFSLTVSGLIFMPVWLALTTKGITALGRLTESNHISHLAGNAPFVWIAGMASQLFYLNSMIRVMGALKKACRALLMQFDYPEDADFKQKAKNILFMSIIASLSGAVAWFSATGMSGVVQRMLNASFELVSGHEATTNTYSITTTLLRDFTAAGFGLVAQDTFFKIPGMLALYALMSAHIGAMIAAVVVAGVNGRSMADYYVDVMNKTESEKAPFWKAFFYVMFSYTSEQGAKNIAEAKKSPINSLMIALATAIEKGTFVLDDRHEVLQITQTHPRSLYANIVYDKGTVINGFSETRDKWIDQKNKTKERSYCLKMFDRFRKRTEYPDVKNQPFLPAGRNEQPYPSDQSMENYVPPR